MSDRKHKARVTRLAVGPADEPLFSEMVTPKASGRRSDWAAELCGLKDHTPRLGIT